MILLIFDLDGTLVDSQHPHYLAFKDAFNEFGFEFTEGDFRLLFGKLWRDIVKDYLVSRGLEPNTVDYVKLADRKQEIFRERYVDGVRAFPGVKENLINLRQEGYMLALASNSPRKNIDGMLLSSELAGLFDFIVGVDEVPHPKPHPSMLIKACDTLKVSAEMAVAVDDSLHGIHAGKDAGMKTVAVLTGGSSEAELKGLNPDLIVGSAADLDKSSVNALFKVGDNQ
ncbi:MAG: HAD family phosphatase [Candidatus Altiarchaeota archaeon]|nr:HAD family phosphatase [Candidatus Altiarchaeota archaeon]